MLSLIGRDGIFAEYTRHDITHINELLRLVDMVVPPVTRSALTPADWLLLTLSIYFHDFGMLVTADEYRDRELFDYPAFRHSQLIDSERGQDLKHKLATLTPDEGERFLYQEYVRTNHAKRIRKWLSGGIQHGEATSTPKQIKTLMSSLPEPFRNDLVIVF